MSCGIKLLYPKGVEMRCQDGCSDDEMRSQDGYSAKPGATHVILYTYTHTYVCNVYIYIYIYICMYTHSTYIHIYICIMHCVLSFMRK
jgi:hypothetical protein